MMNWHSVINRLYRSADFFEEQGELTACRILKHIGFALEDGLDAYRHQLTVEAQKSLETHT